MYISPGNVDIQCIISCKGTPHVCFLSISVGQFQNGIAEGEVDASFGPLEAMRLSVLTDSPVWVILSEVGQKNSINTLDKSKMTPDLLFTFLLTQ